jgi:hypothetical protein
MLYLGLKMFRHIAINYVNTVLNNLCEQIRDLCNWI